MYAPEKNSYNIKLCWTVIVKFPLSIIVICINYFERLQLTTESNAVRYNKHLSVSRAYRGNLNNSSIRTK